jgi:Fur family ferric uptake transcriptional regulator
MEEDLKLILKKYRVNSTKPTLLILKSFLPSVQPRTHAYFVNLKGENLDRTTIFRNLRLFVKKNIIYRIPTTDGVCRYLLQKSNSDSVIKSHSNFICIRCKKIRPVNIKTSPKIKLPQGYEQYNVEIIIGGLCKTCKRL